MMVEEIKNGQFSLGKIVGQYPLVVRHGPEIPHSVENLDTIPFHVYRVEFKTIEFRN
jgi:hypothetical protein